MATLQVYHFYKHPSYAHKDFQSIINLPHVSPKTGSRRKVGSKMGAECEGFSVWFLPGPEQKLLFFFIHQSKFQIRSIYMRIHLGSHGLNILIKGNAKGGTYDFSEDL